MAKQKLVIECDMEERWIPYFQSFLRQMQFMGEIGHSANLAFFVDGDGDFKPKFIFDKGYPLVSPIEQFTDTEVDAIYDAG